jgi:hypothetical protein
MDLTQGDNFCSAKSAIIVQYTIHMLPTHVASITPLFQRFRHSTLHKLCSMFMNDISVGKLSPFMRQRHVFGALKPLISLITIINRN